MLECLQRSIADEPREYGVICEELAQRWTGSV